MTTQSLRNFCKSLVNREPAKIKYASDEEYAERVCESIDPNFEKSLEDLDSTINLSAVSSDDDEARMEDCNFHPHYHPPGEVCDCTDYDDSETGFDSPASQERRQREIVKFNRPLAGIVV